MKRLTILATLLFAAVSVSAQDYHIKLWDNTTAPTSNGVTGDEYERKPGTLTNTSSAEIWIYKPAPEKATGQAIVFCPGGGYSQLSIANGHNTCKWFAENGIVGVMLKYRLPNGLGCRKVTACGTRGKLCKASVNKHSAEHQSLADG